MRRHRAALLTTALIVAAATAGCDADSPNAAPRPPASQPTLPASIPTAAPTTSNRSEPVDYTRLLLQPRDISTDNDTFTAEAPTSNPDGRPGAGLLLVNQQQTKAVNIVVMGLPDPAAAPAALAATQASIPRVVNGGPPRPSPVGTGGTIVSGTSPDGTKSITVLTFSEGPAIARIQFDGIPGQPAPEAFVTDVGQKQDIALRVGLPKT